MRQPLDTDAEDAFQRGHTGLQDMMETKREILQRLKIAQRQTERGFLRDGLLPDLHPGTEIASAWPFITAGYCGIEQTFKFLIANGKGISVEELVALRGERKNEFPFKTHDLHVLYRHLDDTAREKLEDYYRIFRSLHDYLDVGSLGDFLEIVSNPPEGKAGRGYESWRYSLTDPESRIPRNSPVFLLAIWRAAVMVIEDREYERRSVLTPDKEIMAHLWPRLEFIMSTVCVRRQDKGLPFENYIEQYQAWVLPYGHPLNALATVLRDASRDAGPAQSGASGTLEESVVEWIAWLRKHVEQHANYNVRRFHARAIGLPGGAGGIRWNAEQRLFEDVPWELSPNWLDAPPPGSFRFDCLNGGRRDLVADFLRRTGLQVRENRHLTAPTQSEGDEWLCTLRAEPKGTDLSEDERFCVRVWESRKSLQDDTDFFVEVVVGNSEEGRRVERLLRDWSITSVGSGARLGGSEEGAYLKPDG